MWHMGDMGAAWWVLTSLGWLLIWGFVVWAAVSLVRDRNRRRGDETSRREPTAREVLDRRLAEGEITVEEYERLRDALRRPAAPTPTPS